MTFPILLQNRGILDALFYGTSYITLWLNADTHHFSRHFLFGNRGFAGFSLPVKISLIRLIYVYDYGTLNNDVIVL